MSISWNTQDPAHPSTPTLRLLVFGDSFVLGGGCGKRFAFQAAELIKAETSDVPDLKVLGINGVSFDFAWSSAGYPYTLIQDVTQRLAPLVSSTSLPVWVYLQAGTNGIAVAGHDAATEYADFQACLAAIVATGIPAGNIVVGTMVPRPDGIFPGVEGRRNTLNSLLVGGAGAGGYRLARNDMDANIGAAGANTNTTYFQSDLTHPNDAGAAIMAGIFKGAQYA